MPKALTDEMLADHPAPIDKYQHYSFNSRVKACGA
jgi:hypothetical protein